jgi:hypothetical protein
MMYYRINKVIATFASTSWPEVNRADPSIAERTNTVKSPTCLIHNTTPPPLVSFLPLRRHHHIDVAVPGQAAHVRVAQDRLQHYQARLRSDLDRFANITQDLNHLRIVPIVQALLHGVDLVAGHFSKEVTSDEVTLRHACMDVGELAFCFEERSDMVDGTGQIENTAAHGGILSQ